ncbi:MerR family transcriptional regulator [Consotaella aegiceratis]|uniref:MerR family transcriptional regulator n=1 Tax=Consotaella aegiceratis TaxID=3097961 RepID=UPI002F409107
MDLSIGELSRRTGVKVPTIRYYEQAGLMPPPLRTEGRQRRYGAAEASRLEFIRHARELGFQVEAIRELLALSAQPDQSCTDVDRIARRHLSEVERRISQLVALRDELQRMLSECGHGRISECRVIDSLAGHAHCTADHERPDRGF